MATVPQQDGLFIDDGMPSRGLIGDFIMLITQPVAFFHALGRRRSSRTVWLALIILVILVFNALQFASAGDASTDSDNPPMSDFPGEGMPFDPGFPPNTGGDSDTVTTSDPNEQWMTALSAVGAQVIQWFVLAGLLSEVTVFNRRKPQLGKNLQIVIWASVPLALMAILQVIFMAAGGTVTEPGLSGFLDEWSRFPELHIRLQSFIHALASQVTLFWLWSLALLYLGARLTLRGKQAVVILMLSTWIILLGVAYSFESYDKLKDAQPQEQPITEDMISDDGMLPEDFSTDDGMLPDDFSENPETMPEDGSSDEQVIVDEIQGEQTGDSNPVTEIPR